MNQILTFKVNTLTFSNKLNVVYNSIFFKKISPFFKKTFNITKQIGFFSKTFMKFLSDTEFNYTTILEELNKLKFSKKNDFFIRFLKFFKNNEISSSKQLKFIRIRTK